MDRKPQAVVSIRPYEQSDLERVRWLFARTPPWGRTYSRPEPLPHDLEDIRANYPDGSFVALELDQAGEAVVGFVAVSAVSEEEEARLPHFLRPAGNISRIHWVSVVPERWRLGLGRRLTNTAVEWSRKRRCTAAILETTSRQEGAIALYESMGFLEQGRSVIGPYEQVWFRLTL